MNLTLSRDCSCRPALTTLTITTAVTMSWPSAYGYKYTPIGLRQRERKDDHSGTRSICTTVHLPQGGHLLDIERQYGMDGSMSKRVSPLSITLGSQVIRSSVTVKSL